jgi:hypothetical protein
MTLDSAIDHFLVYNSGLRLAEGKFRLPQNLTLQPLGLNSSTENSVLGFR